MQITVIVQDDLAIPALTRAIERLGSARPLYLALGEALVATTQQRFDTETDPSGQSWVPNRPVTIERYAARFGSNRAQRAADKKVLTGESGALRHTLNYQATDQSVLIGSPQIYAAVQQLGARKLQFGVAPWGAIPARPYLGLSAEDERIIGDAVADYIDAAFA